MRSSRLTQTAFLQESVSPLALTLPAKSVEVMASVLITPPSLNRHAICIPSNCLQESALPLPVLLDIIDKRPQSSVLHVMTLVLNVGVLSLLTASPVIVDMHCSIMAKIKEAANFRLLSILLLNSKYL